MSLMMTVSQMTREGHHGQVGGRAPATLAVNRGLFLGAPRPVEGHRRQWPSWPSIISYPVLTKTPTVCYGHVALVTFVLVM